LVAHANFAREFIVCGEISAEIGHEFSPCRPFSVALCLKTLRCLYGKLLAGGVTRNDR
jgi:hypothetical protein